MIWENATTLASLQLHVGPWPCSAPVFKFCLLDGGIVLFEVRKGTGFVSAADLPSDNEEDWLMHDSIFGLFVWWLSFIRHDNYFVFCHIWKTFSHDTVLERLKLVARQSHPHMHCYCLMWHWCETIDSSLCNCQEEKGVTFDVSPKALSDVILHLHFGMSVLTFISQADMHGVPHFWF